MHILRRFPREATFHCRVIILHFGITSHPPPGRMLQLQGYTRKLTRPKVSLPILSPKHVHARSHPCLHQCLCCAEFAFRGTYWAFYKVSGAVGVCREILHPHLLPCVFLCVQCDSSPNPLHRQMLLAPIPRLLMRPAPPTPPLQGFQPPPGSWERLQELVCSDWGATGGGGDERDGSMCGQEVNC